MQRWKLLTFVCSLVLLKICINIVLDESISKKLQSAGTYLKFPRLFERFAEENKNCAVNVSGCKVFECPEFENLNSDWMNASLDGSFSVYSSYYYENQITIIGAAIKTNVPLFCQIWGRTKKLTISMFIVKARIRYLSEHHKTR